ncbi:MAG: protoporphyrinogen oxidase [Planctomycetales bacterium]
MDQSHAATHPWRVAVVGGGLAGLAAAHRLQALCEDADRPLDLVLFEAAERLGGVIGPSRRGDWLVEPAADSFITTNPWATDLCRELGLEDEIIPTEERYRGSLVLRKGRAVPVPDGFLLLAPAKIGAVLRSPIFSPWGKLRLALEYFVPRRRRGGDESLASFVRRRFGREALDRLVQPLVGGIYTADPEKLSLAATMPRYLEMERTHRSLIVAARKHSAQPAGNLPPEARSAGRCPPAIGSGARYGLFVTLRGGMWDLVAAFERRLVVAAQIRTGVAVERIAQVEPAAGERGPLYELFLADGGLQTFDAVVLALPAYRAAQLLAALDADLAALLRGIEYASSAVVVSGHALADVSHPLDAFGLVVPARERRRIIAISFASRKFPGRAPEGKVLLRTFVGGALQPEMFAKSDDEILAAVREELREILGVSGRPDFETVHRWPRAMAQYHVGHLDRVARIEQRLAAHPALALAGNALHGVGIPHVLHSGEEAARRLFATIGKRGA